MSRQLAIGYLGSPEFSASLLHYLVRELSDLVCIKAVWTNPPRQAGRGTEKKSTPVSKCAKSLGIDVIEKSIISEADLHLVKEKKIDLLLVVAYGSILPKFFFDAPRFGSYNIHFSLLPAYRGASPIQSAILKGEEESGITLQKIAEKLDSGPIVMQKKFSIKDCNFERVLAISLEKSKEMLKEFFSSKNIADWPHVKQKESEATYCKKVKKINGKIGAQDSCFIFRQKLLAYTPWPGLFFYVQNQKIEVFDYRPVCDNSDNHFDAFLKHMPARCLFVDEEGRLVLVLVDGVVNITRLKRAGKKEMDASEFVRGYQKKLPTFIDNL